MRRTLRAIPTLLRIGVAETVAYRAEFLVWLLVTTLPLVMLALWSSVASEAPFRGFQSEDFVAYYLSGLIVRNVTGSWVGWQISEEIRLGTMAMRLLRPLHPYVAFAASHIAAIPFRLVVALPIAVILLLSSGASALTREPGQLALLAPSLALGWMINFNLVFILGTISFWATKTMALMNVYFAMFSLFSGYLLPIPLLPSLIADVASVLPFRFGFSAPLELMTRHLDGEQLALLMGGQVGWAAVTLVAALSLWHAGVKRFEAVGS
ncbi:MAG: ABC transporter permease [Kofleriaceae bacterium]